MTSGFSENDTLWETYKKLLKMVIYSGFSHKKMVNFHSYVKLPEGKSVGIFMGQNQWISQSMAISGGMWLKSVDFGVPHLPQEWSMTTTNMEDDLAMDQYLLIQFLGG